MKKAQLRANIREAMDEGEYTYPIDFDNAVGVFNNLPPADDISPWISQVAPLWSDDVGDPIITVKYRSPKLNTVITLIENVTDDFDSEDVFVDLFVEAVKIARTFENRII